MNGANSENLVVRGEKRNKHGDKVLQLECMTTHKTFEDVASCYVVLGRYSPRYPTSYLIHKAGETLEDVVAGYYADTNWDPKWGDDWRLN
ncbi:hypothetical protein N9Z27_00330 [Alphaproteobacteria bacterium]|nr:hypothetical protein [Alphaproteobacteria bacterium]